MIDTVSKERRSYVRGDISFKVTFNVVSPEEYEHIKRSKQGKFSSTKRKQGIDSSVIVNEDPHGAFNTSLIDFFLHLDEKLDRILEFVSRDMPDKPSSKQALGSNISGSGMNIITDTSLEPGEIIHVNFVLSRFPLVFIEVFGEIVRATPVDENGKTWYHLGIHFLDLNLNDREKIIACVFQRQRETIRKEKDVELKMET
jgi:hypothetical protein